MNTEKPVLTVQSSYAWLCLDTQCNMTGLHFWEITSLKSSRPFGYFSDMRFISSFALAHVSGVFKTSRQLLTGCGTYRSSGTRRRREDHNACMRLLSAGPNSKTMSFELVLTSRIMRSCHPSPLPGMTGPYVSDTPSGMVSPYGISVLSSFPDLTRYGPSRRMSQRS